tara:strand:+ start:1444 stop:2292 length:849 start_codon:yes stop_codon:yes gene_type:complete
MNPIEKIKNSNPERLKRKEFLEPLADSLNLDHKIYKNRKTLCDAIINANKNIESLKKIENDTDFATLEPIVNISKDRLVYWKQNNKLYASDVISMKQWFDSGNYISPYALENASGILESQNPEEYSKRFDLRNIDGFVDSISEKYLIYQNIIDSNENDNVPVSTLLRFKIEKYANDMYITPILNFIEKQEPKKVMKIILSNLNFLKIYFLETFIVTQETTTNFTDIFFIIDQIYVSVIQLHIKHPFVYLLHVIECLSEVLDPSMNSIVIIKFFENFNQILNI